MNKIYLPLLFQLFIASIVSAQTNWKLRAEKEGIKIYMSEMPNSKIKAVKVECEIRTTLSALVAVIMDVKASPEWVYHTKTCSLVKQVSVSELYYYSEISLPWPTQNRDFVAHLTVTQNPDTRVVTIDGPAVKGFVDVKDGIVRIDHSKGKWLITPDGPDHVKIEYTLHVDPSGSVPAWLVNLFAADGPMQIFKKLKLQVQKPEYKNLKLGYLAE